MINGIFDYINC